MTEPLKPMTLREAQLCAIPALERVANAGILPERNMEAAEVLRANPAVDVDAILKVAEEMDAMTDCDVWKKPYIAANAWADALRKACGK